MPKKDVAINYCQLLDRLFSDLQCDRLNMSNFAIANDAEGAIASLI
ncbi:MAG: hypothetical protein ACOYMQ_19285 [Pseudanabaena sp.]